MGDAKPVRGNDGGGEFFAARVPLVGREKIALFYRTVAKQVAGQLRVEVRMLNGWPALVTENPAAQPGYAPRVATLFDIGSDGRIQRIYSVLAPRKLKALR